MKPSEKAEIAVLKVTIRAVEKGAFVSKPVVESTRYDLVLDYLGRLYRVQVKYCDNPTKSSVALVHLKSGSYGQVRFKGYTSQEVDLILIYVSKIDRILWVEPDCFEGMSSLSFRLQPAENNQQKGCLAAEDFVW